MSPPLIILGCGFIGGRVARAALAAGRTVRVAGRSAAHLEPYGQLGAEVKTFDATKVRSFGPTLHGLRGATVLYAIPPLPEVPSGEALARATEAASNNGAGAFIYLSSAGLYGDLPSDDWIDEETTPAHDDPSMKPYQHDEAALQNASFAGLRTCTLRLAAVYGPGRGVRARLQKGDYRLIDGGKHWISRIHIDDLVRVIFAAEERAQQGSVYLVGDDRPTTQLEHVSFVARRLGLPLPPSQALYAPGMRRKEHRGRRIRNDKMKSELGVTLQYPSYEEGELALEAELRGDTPSAAAPTPAAPPVARPPFIFSIASLKDEGPSNYPGRTEQHGLSREIGDAAGLTHLGVHLLELPPGQRSSLPHAHSAEDELAIVIEGTPDVWIDGYMHRLAPGDAVGWPAGTGIAHTVMNNTKTMVKLYVIGERKPGVDRIFYPTDAARQGELKPERAWPDVPARERGPHDGKPS